MTESEIIKSISSTIDGSVDKFNSNIPKIQRQILDEIELISKKLKTGPGGNIKRSAENLKLLGELRNKINKIIRSPEYKGLVKEFAETFGKVSKLQNEYFLNLSKTYNPGAVLQELQVQTVKSVLDSLFESGVSTNIGSKVVDILRVNITSGAKFSDLNNQMREYLTTTKAGDGALVKYSKQITTDSLNQFSRSYLNISAGDLGYSWRRYTGSLIATSRPFCEACVKKKYLFTGEYPALLRGDFKEFREADGKINPKTKLPEGMIAGTNPENFDTYAGGYQCNHQTIPVPEESVPKQIRIETYSRLRLDYDTDGLLKKAA